MDSSPIELKSFVRRDGVLPELLTEFMVDMKCKGCVSAVKNNLLKLDGIKNVEVDLSNQVVRVLGSLRAKTMEDALAQTGCSAQLIGQGNPYGWLVLHHTAPRYMVFSAYLKSAWNWQESRLVSGLSPGNHAWAINEFGYLMEGAASTGKVFNPPNHTSEKPHSDLGTLEAIETGEANFSGCKEMIRIGDLIGRSIVLYETEDKSDPGIAAAVIDRSARVGEHYKICTCDGVTIWESS